jgi:histidine triad (HIT) family protein
MHGRDYATRIKVALALIGATAVGIGIGAYLFSDTRPRSFLAAKDCGFACIRGNQLAGLLVSAGVQRMPNLLPGIVKETTDCIAIRHPFPEARYHFVVFPKRDIKNIADVSAADEPAVADCVRVLRELISELRLTDYRVYSNGPGLQEVAYLHFHLVSNQGLRTKVTHLGMAPPVASSSVCRRAAAGVRAGWAP